MTTLMDLPDELLLKIMFMCKGQETYQLLMGIIRMLFVDY
jgi:hypothetical protein